MTRENVRVLLTVLAVCGVVGIIVWSDITAQMKFTEDTRRGLYEAAYQHSINGGAP